MVKNQGEEAEKLSKERRSLWISAISRVDVLILDVRPKCKKKT